MRLRAEMRARWRAWLALAVMFGVAGGVSIAAIAGARRAETAYPRFYEANRGYDVLLGGIGADSPEDIQAIRAQVAGIPQVDDWGFSEFLSLQIEFPRTGSVATFPDIVAVADPRKRDGYEIGVAKVLEGRMVDPAADDEAIVDWLAADRLGLSVGDRAEIRLFGEGEGDEPTIVQAPVEIVGIAIVPGSLPAVGQASFGVLATTAAFTDRYAELLEPSNDAPSVRLRDGVKDIPAFLEALRELPATVDVVATRPEHLQGVKETLRFEVLGLYLVGALIALAAAAVLGQALARETFVQASDFAVLASIGMGRRSLATIGVIRAGAIGAVAALIAFPAALVASVFTPVGLSRIVEPSPGIAMDPPVFAIGMGATLVAILLIAVPPAISAASVVRARDGRQRASAVAARLARTGLPVPALTGVRLALEPGRGARAVPVRSAVLGSIVGVAVLAAALTFSAGLHHLIRTPELYGFNWDFIADLGGGEEAEALLRADPDVETFGRGGAFNVFIEGRPLIPYTYESGGIEPTILEGRAPRGDAEIALGPKLLRALKLRIGDDVNVVFGDHPSGPGGRLRVVGTTVVPAILFQQVLPGEGAAITIESIARFAPERMREGTPHTVRYKEGVDIPAKLGALAEELGFVFAFQVRQPGSDLVSLLRVEDLPVALAGLLGAMAIASLTHALVTSIRRRRHDLAVLKTIGFVGRQVRASVAWQGSTLTVIAVIVGLPLGIAAGRWAWNGFARDLGVVAAPVSPILALALVVPAALLVANAVAALPARAAARTQPAVALRSE